MSFEYPGLAVAGLLAAIAAAVRRRLAERRPAALRFPVPRDPSAPATGPTTPRSPLAARPPVSRRARLVALVWLLPALGTALLSVAAGRPRVPAGEVPSTVDGVDICVVFDISTSMRAADFQPADRFTVAKNTIEAFVKGRTHDRVGLVVFAGEAFTQVPLTLDKRLVSDVLGQLKMGVIKDGTAIGNALAVAVNRLRESTAKSRVIVLLTDGDNNAGNIQPEDAAKMAAELGIRVHTVQVGRGGRVPVPVDNGMFGRTYAQAEIPVNPALLRKIADETEGRYFVAGDAEALEQIFATIDSMERTEIEDNSYKLYEEAFAWFALPGFVLVLAGVLLDHTLLRRFP